MVRLKGRNAMLCDIVGTFSFTRTSRSFVLEEVRKNDYTLLDPDILQKPRKISDEKYIKMSQEISTYQENDKKTVALPCSSFCEPGCSLKGILSTFSGIQLHFSFRGAEVHNKIETFK